MIWIRWYGQKTISCYLPFMATKKQSSMHNIQKELKALATMKTFYESWWRFHFLSLKREDPDPNIPGSGIRDPRCVKNPDPG
jgi:hypothetical protein